MLPRLIATDLDGTFLDPQGHYDHQQFAHILAQLHQRGSRFVIATGDPLDHAQALFRDLPEAASLTYVVEDGALIVTGTGAIVQKRALPSDLVVSAVTWLETAPVMADNFLISCGQTRAYTRLPADSARFHASQAFYPQLTSVPDLTKVNDAILKLDVTWLHADVAPQVAAFNQRFSGQLVATSSGLGGLNVSLPGVSKGQAIQTLAQRWGIRAAEVAAFGDSGNDLAMLQWAGQGIAVANAAPDILAAIPDHTADPNTQPVVLDQLEAWLASAGDLS